MFTEKVVDQSRLDQLWMTLLENNVLTLPSQEMLKDKLQKYVISEADTTYFVGSGVGAIQRTYMTDGLSYGVELSTPIKKKYYNYHCPYAYLKQYGNVKELYDAVVINMLIQKYIGGALS